MHFDIGLSNIFLDMSPQARETKGKQMVLQQTKKIPQSKTVIQKDICTPMFLAASFTIAKIWKQHKCPSMNKWIKKMWCVCVRIYTHTTYIYTVELLSLKND